MFTNTDGKPVHPHSISQSFERIATSSWCAENRTYAIPPR